MSSICAHGSQGDEDPSKASALASVLLQHVAMVNAHSISFLNDNGSQQTVAGQDIVPFHSILTTFNMNLLALFAIIAPALFALETPEKDQVSKRCPRTCPPAVNDCKCPKGYTAFLTYTPPRTVADVDLLGGQFWQCVKIEESCDLDCTGLALPGAKGYCFGNDLINLPNCHFSDYLFDGQGPSRSYLFATFKDDKFSRWIGSYVAPSNVTCDACHGKTPFCALIEDFGEPLVNQGN